LWPCWKLAVLRQGQVAGPAGEFRCRHPEHLCHFSTPGLPKGGLASCPGNYRSIALLNTNYKQLARILTTRFGYTLQLCVGPHQTAFPQGREIGDGIFAAELLGSALGEEQLPGAAVFLDIAKAYVTPWTGPSCFASQRVLGARGPWCSRSSCCAATLVHTLSLIVMCRSPKSGMLLSVRAALCLCSSTSLWWRRWLAGFGSVPS
jgi:hypothetical protein